LQLHREDLRISVVDVLCVLHCEHLRICVVDVLCVTVTYLIVSPCNCIVSIPYHCIAYIVQLHIAQPFCILIVKEIAISCNRSYVPIKAREDRVRDGLQM